MVAGVDEAGRGPLAGPVVAAAVILDLSKPWPGIDDSKQLNAEEREDLYARVLEGARAFAWSAAGPRVIDRLNIRRATHRAMASAVRRLGLAPELVLVDGHETVGDIVAKVVRDRLMERLDKVWPAYGFARHKGYGTPEHLDALRVHGPCPLHRWSFAPVTDLELPLVF